MESAGTTKQDSRSVKNKAAQNCLLLDLLSHADSQDLAILSKLTSSKRETPEAIVTALESRAKNLYEKVTSTHYGYYDILTKTAKAHGIERRLLESCRDLERRLIRTVYFRSVNELSGAERAEFEKHLKNPALSKTGLTPEAVGGTAILAAQASGFGVYQMATTVLGMATSAAGVTIPFLGYMAVTKAISFAIGPLGWIALGVSTLHKLTKPNYAKLLAAITYIHLVRNELEPQLEFGRYSATELLRMLIKIVLPVGLLLFIYYFLFANK